MAGMMAGAMLPPLQSAAGMTMGAGGQSISPSIANAFRVTAVMERLSSHLQPGFDSIPTEFFGLCLSLARGIDFVIANGESLQAARELPFLLKQICQRKGDVFLQAAIMVLMASVKNACMAGWFKEKETKELLTLAKEVGNFFCTSGDINTGINESLSIIPTVMSRFYPLMKMGQVFVSLEAKAGYGTYVTDFHISKNLTISPGDKIRLFVAQTDNTETSACIVTPQEVNFLLNGKGVERRTNVLMDTGPQMPTDVTRMLKYGTNLLQAVGQFKGHYIIAVAIMSMELIPDPLILKEYVSSCAAELDPDSDIIEGPSRISLNCPISYTRIRIPVKGHRCKHLQCFDFRNFMDINTRRPSWRCPHCNQHLCYTDVRVDQNMVKVLRDMKENVNGVIISADGSWKAISEGDDKVDQTHDMTLHCEKGKPEQLESTATTNALPMVMDLTMDDDEIDGGGIIDAEERKPFAPTLLNQPVDVNPIPPVPSQLSGASAPYSNICTQLADDFWASLVNNVNAPNQNFSDLPNANTMTSSVVTDAVSPTPNCSVGVLGSTAIPSVMQNQPSASSSNSQLLQSQFVNSTVNEYGTLPQLYHVSRTPMAVQALPARPVTPTPQQRSRTHSNPSVSSGTSYTSQATLPATGNSLHTVSPNGDMQQLFARLHNATSSAQHQSTAQNWNRQGHSFMHGQSGQQQAGTLPNASQSASAHRLASRSQFYQQALRKTQPIFSSPNVVRSSSPLTPAQTPQGVAQVGVGNSAGATNSQQARFATAQLAAQRTRQPPSVPVHIQSSRAGAMYPASANGIRVPPMEQRGSVGGPSPTAPGSDGLLDLVSEQNWRPTGRMRGSLSGQAYSAALKEFMIPAAQQTPPPRPPNLATSQTTMAPHLQALLARNSQVPQPQNSPGTGSAF